jgi:plasmid stability protein
MTLTLRNIPSEVAEALERESARSHAPLDQTAIDLLRQALKIQGTRNGLAELAGTWTDEEHDRFEKAIAMTEQIDEELWR